MMREKLFPHPFFALFTTWVDNKIMRGSQYGQVIENKEFFLNLKGTFLVCANKKEKCQENIWEKMKKLRRRTRLWQDKLEKRERTDPEKVFSLDQKSNYQSVLAIES